MTGVWNCRGVYHALWDRVQVTEVEVLLEKVAPTCAGCMTPGLLGLGHSTEQGRVYQQRLSTHHCISACDAQNF